MIAGHLGGHEGSAVTRQPSENALLKDEEI
jgi:hypothetical protein